MAMSGGRDDGQPMMEMNTTPLIDVMLVLLIMLIITIPIQTHAVKIDLPQQQNNVSPPIEPDKNKVYIDANGQIYWNALPVDDVTLQQYLEASVQRPEGEPELHFQPDPNARYEVVDHVLAIVKRANVTKLGFVGNEQYGGAF